MFFIDANQGVLPTTPGGLDQSAITIIPNEILTWGGGKAARYHTGCKDAYESCARSSLLSLRYFSKQPEFASVEALMADMDAPLST